MAARNQRENLHQTIRKQTYKENKLENYNKNEIKHKYTFSLGGNATPCPSFGSTSLFGMEYWLVEQWRRGRVNGLRGKGSQGTHTGIITIGREGVF